MKKQEQDLFFRLCRFKDTWQQTEKGKELRWATPAVLGHLFFNRMAGVAYGIMREHQLLGKVNREFRNSLEMAYRNNVQKNDSFYRCLRFLSETLRDNAGKYAMLKGAWLYSLYPEGYRTSNDIDILVRPEDVTEIGNTLSRVGFQQGHIRSGEFVPATRREIIESRMTRGETVPYILPVKLPHMPYMEVDINFSLDYKNGDTAVIDELLKRSQVVTINVFEKQQIITLEKSDFIIHLCQHLYKEAATLPWVDMKRDMTLYKFADMYMLFNSLSEEETRDLFLRAEKLGMADICACAIWWTNGLLGISNTVANTLTAQQLYGRERLLCEVADPEHKRVLEYGDADIRKRFFADDRTVLLKEKEDVI